MVKQVIILRADLGMSPGKAAAQAAHASLACYDQIRNDPEHKHMLDQWFNTGSTKIILQAANEDQMSNLQYSISDLNIPTFMVYDEGRTELDKDTMTALGIGPAEAEEIDKATAHLKLY